MPCLTTAQRARILAQIAQKQIQLVIVNTTYTEALADASENYKFDSNEGAQSMKNRKLSDLKDQIDSLQGEIDQLYRRLTGRGLVSMRLRRY